jgi:hypothetical protein
MLRRALAFATIIACAAPASAGVVFNSLDGATAAAANDALGPMSATFSTGSAAVLDGVSLLLSDAFPDDVGPSDTFFVTLGGGAPLSSLSYDPRFGLLGSIGPAIASLSLPVSILSGSPTDEALGQFAGARLKPDSLYWIEVESSDPIDWGITADVSGPGVATNYLSWVDTDGFFRNRGVEPFPFNNALQMRIDVAAAPEPATWVALTLGFVGLGWFESKKRSRGRAGLAMPDTSLQRVGLSDHAHVT